MLTPYVPKGITGHDDDDDDSVLTTLLELEFPFKINNNLKLLRKTIRVHCESHRNLKNTLCGKNPELNIKVGGI